MEHITPAQVKAWLEANRKAGRSPATMYQAAALRGCSRSLLTMWTRGQRRSRPLERWFVRRMRAGGTVIGEGTAKRMRANQDGRPGGYSAA